MTIYIYIEITFSTVDGRNPTAVDKYPLNVQYQLVQDFFINRIIVVSEGIPPLGCSLEIESGCINMSMLVEIRSIRFTVLHIVSHYCPEPPII